MTRWTYPTDGNPGIGRLIGANQLRVIDTIGPLRRLIEFDT